MSKYKRIRASSIIKEDDRSNLEGLIHRYLEKSEELENKERKVLKQMELMQSAVASFQDWNRQGNSRPISEPALVNLRDIDEETEKIREETRRIQEEVRQKMEDNRKLQQRLDQKRMMESMLMAEAMPEDYVEAVEREKERKKLIEEISDINAGSMSEEDEDSEKEEDTRFANNPRIKFFRDKIRQLKKMEKRLMKESEEEIRLSREKRQNLKEKIEVLEWEMEIDRELVKSLKRKYGSIF